MHELINEWRANRYGQYCGDMNAELRRFYKGTRLCRIATGRRGIVSEHFGIGLAKFGDVVATLPPRIRETCVCRLIRKSSMGADNPELASPILRVAPFLWSK